MRIYTRTGDDGTTALFGGARLSKDDLRIEAYGTLDELNAFVGALADHAAVQADTEDAALLRQIQVDLFNLGSHLATTDAAMRVHLPALPAEREAAMEAWMDRRTAALPELRNFILPGGHPAVSAAHLCRVVSRRAERRVVALARAEAVDPAVGRYLNRLSDWFFVLARVLADRAGAAEVYWTP
ncbi:MAG: hypothetical protein RJA19_1291 [Bacteroidota bacterium]|jgi:cob(I)alamin adenosyltransferase